MEIKDDRDETQRGTHRWLIIGTDSFMSGWGGAAGGASVAAWAVEADSTKIAVVEAWVKRRREMKRVRIVRDDPRRRYRPRNAAHLHIYVVTDDHPSLAKDAAGRYVHA